MCFVFIMFYQLSYEIRFHIAVWSLSKSIRASSFIENFPQISAKPISLSSEICSGSSHEIGRSLPIVFQRNWPRKFPRNRPFFPRICPWKSREIWLFSATYQKPCKDRTKPGWQDVHCLRTTEKCPNLPLFQLYSWILWPCAPHLGSLFQLGF